ncbi:MAG: hypothetical protein M3547_14620 [Acidobacteriota bacterium]|nr:hypothetical protein [Acidobacteriota bacterium]
MTDDIVHGMSPGGLWLYATLMLVERRSGSVIILVLSLLASGLPVLHMTGREALPAASSPAEPSSPGHSSRSA